MSYRKIEVDGTEYQYVIGKTHLKVKGVGVWPKEDIGEITYIRYGCDCGCIDDEHIVYTPEEYKAVCEELEFEREVSIRVRPEHVANKIKETTV